MSAYDYQFLLHLQKKGTERAQKRKGESVAKEDKISRADLQEEFHPTREQDPPTKGGDDGYLAGACFIGYSYPPSTTELEQLTPMLISDLQLETHHTGKVLIVRTFGVPYRIHAVHNAIIDERTNVDRLALYKGDSRFTPRQILPIAAVWAIKEPYYKQTADDGYTVRVDHPSDLVLLRPPHPMMPAEWVHPKDRARKDVMAFKTAGNEAFKKKDWRAAVDQYSSGIAIAEASVVDSLTCDVWRNRSMANLHLGRYREALLDANRSIIPEREINEENHEVSVKNNVKSYFRIACANYHLRKYESATNWFTRVLDLDPEDADAKRELKRTERRIAEETTGKYNFESMFKSVSKEHNRLDHASWRSQVEVRDTEFRGRALFATTDIKAGDVILVEKAVSMACETDFGAVDYSILNLNSNFDSSGVLTTLLHNITRISLYDSVRAREVLALCSGGYAPQCKGFYIDGVTALDTFQLEAVIEQNAFACATTKLFDVVTDENDVFPFDTSLTSVGLWLTASRINHACEGNARRSNFGDMLVVRATRDIAVDEEIRMTYLACDYNHLEARVDQRLQELWGFECDCPICVALYQSSKTSREKRRAMLEEVSAFLDSNALDDKNPPHVAVIDVAQKLWDKIEATYNKQIWQGIPRLGLVQLTRWLSVAYISKRNVRDAMKMASCVLRDLGYIIEIKDDNLTVDRTHAYPDHPGIEAAMLASQVMSLERREDLSVMYKDLAKEIWKVMYGCMSGFEERCIADGA